jgi:ribosomal protein S18 acetylase RimI-like enzyme
MKRRRVEPGDLETLFALHRDAYRHHVEQIWGPWDDASQRVNFARECSQSSCEVFTDQEELVGYVQYVDEAVRVRLWNIVIRTDHRGRGVGTRFVRELQDRAAARGVELSLRVFASNKPAYRFYERLGFSEISRSSEAIEMAWRAG